MADDGPRIRQLGSREVYRTDWLTMREETGLRADAFAHLGRMHSAYGFCSQGFDVFIATGLTPGDADREASESDMVAAWHSEADVRAMVRDGTFADAHSVAALALFDAR